MDVEDYYEILGLTKNATKTDINKKYKELVKKWHPDKCTDKKFAEQKLAEINKAYQILGNENEKEKYDKTFNKYSYDEKTKKTLNKINNFTNRFNEAFPEYESDMNSSMFSSSSDDSSMDMHKFKKQLRELNDEMEKNGMPWEKINTDFDSDVEFHDTDNDPILDTPYKQKLYDFISGDVKKTKGTNIHFDLYLSLEDIHNAKERIIVVNRKTSPYNYEPCLFSFPIRRNMYEGEEISVDYAGNYIDEYGVLTRESGMCIVHIHILTHEYYTKIGSNLYTTFEITLEEAKKGFERKLKDLDGNIHDIKVKKLNRTDHMYVLRGVGIKKFEGFRGDIFVNFAVNLDKKGKIDMEPIKRINPKKKKIIQNNVTIKKDEQKFFGKRYSDNSSDEDNQ